MCRRHAKGIFLTSWIVGVIVCLTWGVVAFGSPYPWAYLPLMIGAATLGIIGLGLGSTRLNQFRVMQLSIASVWMAIAVQLIPLPLDRLRQLSPALEPLLNNYDVNFMSGMRAAHALSIEPNRTRLALGFFVAFGLLFLGSAAAFQRRTARQFAGALASIGAFVAIIGIVQRATFNGRIYGVWQLTQGGSPFGPFINRNHFAGWMLMVVPVSIGFLLATLSRGMNRKPDLRQSVLWFSKDEGNRAALTAFAIFVMALSLVMTLSRSGIVAAGAGCIIATVTIMTRSRASVTNRTLAAAYLLTSLIAVVLWVGVDEIIGRFNQFDSTSMNERPAMWADTVQIIKDFPLTGTGLNTYGISTLFYQTAAVGFHLNEAHNDYLQVIAEGGALVLIPVLVTVTGFVFHVRRQFRRDEGSIRWIRAGAVLSLLTIAVQSFVEFSLQMPANAALFAVTAGLAAHDSSGS